MLEQQQQCIMTALPLPPHYYECAKLKVEMNVVLSASAFNLNLNSNGNCLAAFELLYEC